MTERARVEEISRRPWVLLALLAITLITAAEIQSHEWRTLPDALALTAAAIFAVIETTLRLDRYELALVAAQDELLSPTRRFAPQPL